LALDIKLNSVWDCGSGGSSKYFSLKNISN
jgi:hypothetical protein